MYSKEQKRAGCFASLFPLIVILVLAGGWIQCFIKGVKSDWEPVGKREVFYTLGICIPPAGGVIGWFDIPDKHGEEK